MLIPAKRKLFSTVCMLMLSYALLAQATVPTVASTNLQFSNITLTSMTVSWTPGNGERRVVFAHKDGPVSTALYPGPGGSFTANSQWGMGEYLGMNHYVVYDGTGSSFTLTGLSNSTLYGFVIFEYNGLGQTTNYLVNTNLTGSQNSGGAVAPTVNSTSLVFSNINLTSMTLSWTPGNGERRVVIASSYGPVSRTLGKGQTYSANTEWGLGQYLGAYNFVVYDGTGSSFTLTGLTNSTEYAFAVFEYNGQAETSNYFIDSPLTGFHYTAGATRPTVNSTNLTFSSITATGMKLSWTPGNGERRVVYIKNGGTTVNRDPAQGQSFQANSQLSLAEYLGEYNSVVYDGTGSSVTLTGLTNSTVYGFSIFEYNGLGPTSSYLINSPLTGSKVAGVPEPPTVASTNIKFTQISSSSMNISWNPGNGQGRLVIVRSASTVVSKVPSQGQTYTADAYMGNGQNLGENNFVVYNASGNSLTLAGLNSDTQYAVEVFEYNGVTSVYTYLTTATLKGNHATAPESTSLCAQIYCNENGVGIGTSHILPGYSLTVLGKVMAEGVKVEAQSDWPDFVFEKDHKLMGILEVDKYIQSHGHLPEIPSAKQIAEEGIDLGDMNTKMLQKIEELTLYIIRQEKDIEELKKLIKTK